MPVHSHAPSPPFTSNSGLIVKHTCGSSPQIIMHEYDIYAESRLQTGPVPNELILQLPDYHMHLLSVSRPSASERENM